VFAVTDALVASRQRMDITSFILLGSVTGMGGGTLRDAMLGALPVFWVREPGLQPNGSDIAKRVRPADAAAAARQFRAGGRQRRSRRIGLCAVARNGSASTVR